MNKAAIETIKATIRYAVLFAPVILQALEQIEIGAWGAVVSIILTAADKGIHESEVIPYRGLMPF